MISAILENLDKFQGQRCLWCLVSTYLRLDGERVSFLHMYETEVSRSRGLKYFQRENQLSDVVFFTFEIPVDIYLEGAIKHI